MLMHHKSLTKPATALSKKKVVLMQSFIAPWHLNTAKGAVE